MNKEKWHNTLKQVYGDKDYGLYGSKSFKEKMLKKYGVEHVTQSKEIREKIRKTNLEKYGVECNLQLISSSENSKKNWDEQGDEIREKIKNTSMRKYGTESPNQAYEVKEKQKIGLIKNWGSIENAYSHKQKVGKATKLEKYGDSNYHNKEQMSKTLKQRHLDFEKTNNCTRYTRIVKKYGQGWFALNLPIIYNGRFRYISNDYLQTIEKYSKEKHNLQIESKSEQELCNFIDECLNHKYRIFRNTKNIIKDDRQKYELDIYIPKLKLAFEYNGNYWHSNRYKDKYYHQTKTKLCYERGIQLVHIFEFDWLQNKENVKQKITELLNGQDCSKYNWPSVEKYNDYILTEPNKIQLCKDKFECILYDEGTFVKKTKIKYESRKYIN